MAKFLHREDSDQLHKRRLIERMYIKNRRLIQSQNEFFLMRCENFLEREKLKGKGMNSGSREERISREENMGLETPVGRCATNKSSVLQNQRGGAPGRKETSLEPLILRCLNFHSLFCSSSSLL